MLSLHDWFPWRLKGEREAGSSPGQGAGSQPTGLRTVLKLSVKGGALVRDTSKCKKMVASEYMTPEQQEDLLAAWNGRNCVLREAISAPEWAHYVDRDGTAYSVEYLAEEWVQEGSTDGEPGTREFLMWLCPQLAASEVMRLINARVTEGELRELVDSFADAA